MKNRKNVFSLLLISLLGMFIFYSGYVSAVDVPLSDEAQMCLGCHTQKGITKTFLNKEKLSVFVDAKQFTDSVHSFLPCTTCHTDISMESHPPGTAYKGKGEFSEKASNVCKTCHTNEQINKRPIHRYLITKAKAPTCAGCHGIHAIRRIADWKPKVTETHYCLACHQHDINISVGREAMSLKIDESLIRGSVHRKHTCSDCHAEFSKEKHPVRVIKDVREHSIAVSDVCKKCHFDKFALMENSIHSVMLKKGMLGAPVCTDCHGFHTVSPKAKYETMVGAPCRKCHADISNAYKESVHGKAKVKGVEKAPICSSCHQAHDVKVTSLTEQMKKVCLGCHKGAEGAHKKWLTNTELHLDAIGCAACHSPNVEREIYLRLYNLTAGIPFTEEQVLNLLGTNRDGLRKEIDPDGNGIDAYELGRIASHLEKKGMKVALMGRMDVRKGIDPHQLALKSSAVKNCERCHSADSEFFKYVAVAVIRADGKPTIFEAKQEVLGSLVSILPLSKFYVLGSTRIWLLDILLILAVVGGASFPIGHIALRLLTIPVREARRLKALKKEGKNEKNIS